MQLLLALLMALCFLTAYNQQGSAQRLSLLFSW